MENSKSNPRCCGSAAQGIPCTDARPERRFEYSFGPVHFIHYSTEQAFEPGSEQHAWVKAALERVDRRRTPWLVMGGHRPIYIDSTNDGPPDSDQVVAAKLRVRCLTPRLPPARPAPPQRRRWEPLMGTGACRVRLRS